MKVKYIVLAVLAMFSFSKCDEEYAKVPSSVPVDFSKKGTVYETNFKAPWNIWGSNIGFFIVPNMSNKDMEKHKHIYDYISTGYEHDGDGYIKPPENTPYFKVKITLTPLGWASHEVPIMISQSGSRKEKLYTKGQVIEEIVSIPLYGKTPIVINWYKYKTIMVADLQRLRNYHVRVESLEDVEVPSFVHTELCIRAVDRKH